MRAVSFFSILALTGAIAFTSPALAQGDAANGQRDFNKSKACHTVEEGKNKVAPTLYNITGRRAGSLEDFRDPRALKEYGEEGRRGAEETRHANLETPQEETGRGAEREEGCRNG